MEADQEDLTYRLRKRAEIRRQISSRKSVQEGKPDRLADLLDEAADEIDRLEQFVQEKSQITVDNFFKPAIINT